MFLLYIFKLLTLIFNFENEEVFFIKVRDFHTDTSHPKKHFEDKNSHLLRLTNDQSSENIRKQIHLLTITLQRKTSNVKRRNYYKLNFTIQKLLWNLICITLSSRIEKHSSFQVHSLITKAVKRGRLYETQGFGRFIFSLIQTRIRLKPFWLAAGFEIRIQNWIFLLYDMDLAMFPHNCMCEIGATKHWWF